MRSKVVVIGAVACVLALLVAGLAMAQPPAGGQRDRGGDRGAPGDRGGRQFDPAQVRQMMAQRMKEQLGASDAEWKVMEPRLMKVIELSRQSGGMGRGGMMGGMMFGGARARPGEEGRGPGGDRGGRPQGPPAEQMSPVDKATEQLRTTLEDQSATPEQIKNALTTLRAAREKARQELATARQELRQILTVRQEGQLVLWGQLE